MWNAIGIGLGLAGSLLGSRSEKKAAKAGREAAEANARLAEEEIGQVEIRTAVELARLRQEARRFAGSQRAAYAGAGVRLSGSALDVLEDTAAMAEQDAKLVQWAGDWDVRGLKAEAEMQRRYGQSAYRAGMLNARATLLGGLYQTWRAI